MLCYCDLSVVEGYVSVAIGAVRSPQQSQRPQQFDRFADVSSSGPFYLREVVALGTGVVFEFQMLGG